ncbi:F-box/kelch-repeat protein At3g23880-like [Bidens hawaiensis]|uniref:F-box/kelch-repeat protein At3g23880-like n=1 Tax=Bidens hawaiensis TaxID=980011 RepID=UPI0040494B99
MADVVHDDVLEQILIELDVKDLIRYKSVCKSWYSLLTSSGFIKCHLTHSCNKDRYNNNLGRRIITSSTYCGSSDHHCLVGSSNGLVCIYSRESCTVVVGNPLTRESRQRRLPNGIGRSFYWAFGFGYDSSTDDYKVIVGGQDVPCNSKTWFQVLSLKSNVWRVVGELKYAFSTRFGILCNGALH